MESEGASLSICPTDVVSKKSNKTISVLVVDNDASCLATILKEFKYEVATVRLARDALSVLRIKEGAFDLVVTDVEMQDMNGFELLQTIVNEFKNLPIVLMSSDPGDEVTLKGLEKAISYFLLKPVCRDNVKDLWQFVMDPKKKSSMNEGPAEKKGKASLKKKGKASQKKAKMVWTSSLNNSFLQAICTIGIHRAVPRKILEVMNIEGLTRDNVASKLQKYRLFLKELSDLSYKVQNSASHPNRTGENSLIIRLKKSPFKQPVEQYFPAAEGLFGKSQQMLPNRGRPSMNQSPSSFDPLLMSPTMVNKNTYGNSSTLTSSEPFQGNSAVVQPSSTGGYTNIAETRVNPFSVGNDINHFAGGQLSDVVIDYRVMQPPLNPSPPLTNEGNVAELNHEPAYSPMFDIQHLEAFVNSQPPLDQGAFHNTIADQSLILNQPQNGGGTFEWRRNPWDLYTNE